VFQLGVGLVALFLSLTAGVSDRIEAAFLRNDPGLLSALFPREEAIAVSFPAPLSFSDELSAAQAHFLFQKIFRTYSTFEFYPEEIVPTSGAGPGRFIFKARWSFLDKAGYKPMFHIFFLIRVRRGAARPGDMWEIAEIKAEKGY
jgi:hypothetical protein